MWPSTTKYFSPFVRTRCLLAGWVECFLTAATSTPGLRRYRGQVEAEVIGRVLGVGEHDRAVIGVDHPAVVGGHVFLELGLVEGAGLLAQCLGDLVVDDVHPADRVDPDH